MAPVYRFPRCDQITSVDDDDEPAEMRAEDTVHARHADLKDPPQALPEPLTRHCCSDTDEQDATPDKRRVLPGHRRRRSARSRKATRAVWRRRPVRSRCDADDPYSFADDEGYDLIQPVLLEWDEDAEDWEEVWSEASEARFWRTMEERTAQLFRAANSDALAEPRDPACTRGAMVLAFDRAHPGARPRKP